MWRKDASSSEGTLSPNQQGQKSGKFYDKSSYLVILQIFYYFKGTNSSLLSRMLPRSWNKGNWNNSYKQMYSYVKLMTSLKSTSGKSP